jgi:hypothetical protein
MALCVTVLTGRTDFIGDDYHVFSATHVAWLQIIRELGAKGVNIPMITYPAATAGPVYEGSPGYHRGAPLGLGIVLLDDTMYKRDLEEAQTLGPESTAWVKERHRLLQDALADREHKPYSFHERPALSEHGVDGVHLADDRTAFSAVSSARSAFS